MAVVRSIQLQTEHLSSSPSQGECGVFLCKTQITELPQVREKSGKFVLSQEKIDLWKKSQGKF